MHRLTTLFVVAMLLTCPFACLSGSACCASPGTETPSACCEHCARTQSPADGTDAPADEEPCTTCCLCKGAVLGEVAPDYRPADDSLFVLPAVVSVAMTSPTAIVCEGRSLSPWSGDGLRIALGSLTC